MESNSIASTMCRHVTIVTTCHIVSRKGVKNEYFSVMGCSDPVLPPADFHLILKSQLQETGTYYSVGHALVYEADIENGYQIQFKKITDPEELILDQTQQQVCQPNGKWTDNLQPAVHLLGTKHMAVFILCLQIYKV